MKIVPNDSNDDNNQPLHPAEPETLRQREADHGNGLTSNRVRFLEKTVLFPLTMVSASHVVDNGQWRIQRPE